MDVVDIMKGMKSDNNNISQSQTNSCRDLSFLWRRTCSCSEQDHGDEKINLMKRQSVERRQSANAEEAVCVNDVLDTKEKRKSWGVCYCGGAKVVEESVRSVSTELDIEFRIESFNW